MFDTFNLHKIPPLPLENKVVRSGAKDSCYCPFARRRTATQSLLTVSGSSSSESLGEPEAYRRAAIAIRWTATADSSSSSSCC